MNDTIKAEIHCHIEGAVAPELAQKQAQKYNTDLSDVIVDGAYHWNDFTQFLHCYDKIASLFRSRDDYAALAETYLTELAAQGAIYSEFFISTDHAQRTGLDPLAYIEGLADGMVAAKAKTGIEARMIATGIRHEGPQAAMEAAQLIANNPHPLVTGWGMGGDERMHHPKDFAPAFDVARDAGLGITTHAGEFGGPQSIKDSLEWLRPSRIGHGVRAIEDAALVKQLADQQIVLEVCPVSNVVLSVFENFAAHPLKQLLEQGVRVTINSDDPPHFHTNLAKDYAAAREEIGLSEAQIDACTRTAIEAAFVDEETQAALLGRLA